MNNGHWGKSVDRIGSGEIAVGTRIDREGGNPMKELKCRQYALALKDYYGLGGGGNVIEQMGPGHHRISACHCTNGMSTSVALWVLNPVSTEQSRNNSKYKVRSLEITDRQCCRTGALGVSMECGGT